MKGSSVNWVKLLIDLNMEKYSKDANYELTSEEEQKMMRKAANIAVRGAKSASPLQLEQISHYLAVLIESLEVTRTIHKLLYDKITKSAI